jgi:hypothetical protein
MGIWTPPIWHHGRNVGIEGMQPMKRAKTIDRRTGPWEAFARHSAISSVGSSSEASLSPSPSQYVVCAAAGLDTSDYSRRMSVSSSASNLPTNESKSTTSRDANVLRP